MTTQPQDFNQLTKLVIARSYDFGVLEAKRLTPTPVALAHVFVYKALGQAEAIRDLPLEKQGKLFDTVQEAYKTGLDKGRKLGGSR